MKTVCVFFFIILLQFEFYFGRFVRTHIFILHSCERALYFASIYPIGIRHHFLTDINFIIFNYKEKNKTVLYPPKEKKSLINIKKICYRNDKSNTDIIMINNIIKCARAFVPLCRNYVRKFIGRKSRNIQKPQNKHKWWKMNVDSFSILDIYRFEFDVLFMFCPNAGYRPENVAVK